MRQRSCRKTACAFRAARKSWIIRFIKISKTLDLYSDNPQRGRKWRAKRYLVSFRQLTLWCYLSLFFRLVTFEADKPPPCGSFLYWWLCCFINVPVSSEVRDITVSGSSSEPCLQTSRAGGNGRRRAGTSRWWSDAGKEWKQSFSCAVFAAVSRKHTLDVVNILKKCRNITKSTLKLYVHWFNCLQWVYLPGRP